MRANTFVYGSMLNSEIGNFIIFGLTKDSVSAAVQVGQIRQKFPAPATTPAQPDPGER